MKQVVSLSLFALLSISTVFSNDGVYFTSGNFLQPIKETDISVAKEILTISIDKDSFATVDVYYEFMNNGKAKNITMAFEATAPYNDDSPLSHKGIHPHIKDFTATMNGKQLNYRNAVVALHYQDGNEEVDFTPLDMNKWKGEEAYDSIVPVDNELYNAELDSFIYFGYAYYFDAPFKKGKNIVHHTYRYRMSYNVLQKFEIPYSLPPATRWANHKIDDFTLNITCDEGTDFCLADSIFRDAPFTSTRNMPIYYITDYDDQHKLFASILKGDTIRWQCKNFAPKQGMCISSPMWERTSISRRWNTFGRVVIEKNGDISQYCADSGDSYLVVAQDYGLVKKSESHIEEYSAENGQGVLIINDDIAKQANVREKPTTKSSVITTISYHQYEIPDIFPCLGLVETTDEDKTFMWYKTEIDGKIGYIRQDLMHWDSVGFY